MSGPTVNISCGSVSADECALESDLKARVVRGTLWAFLDRFAPQLLMLLVIPILARLLVPHDFGLAALASICVGILDLFSDYGFGSAIIHQKDLCEHDLRTAFTFNVGVGAILFILSIISLPLFVAYWHEPQLRELLPVLALLFLLSPFLGMPMVLLQRNMMFRELAYARAAGVVGYATVSLSCALMGFGVWSLIIATIAEPLCKLPVLYRYSPWRYRFGWNQKSIRRLSGYGIYLFLFRVVDYVSMQLDKILLGRMVGVGMLGYYTIADSMSKKLFYQLGIPIGNVLFPALAGIRHDAERLRQAALSAFRTLALLILPITAILWAVAPNLIYVLLGPKWMESVLLFRILAVGGGLMVIGGIVGPVFLAVGKTDVHFKLGFVNSAMRIAAVVVGARWGLIGIAVALTAINGIIFMTNPYVLTKVLKWDFQKLVGACLLPLAGSVVVILVLEVVNRSFVQGTSFAHNAVELVLKTALAVLVCGGFYRLFQVDVITMVRDMVKMNREKVPPA